MELSRSEYHRLIKLLPKRSTAVYVHEPDDDLVDTAKEEVDVVSGLEDYIEFLEGRIVELSDIINFIRYTAVYVDDAFGPQGRAR
jgi:hypothetical protein